MIEIRRLKNVVIFIQTNLVLCSQEKLVMYEFWHDCMNQNMENKQNFVTWI